MKLKHNVEYTLKDNKGYLMAVDDQSTSFKTIINFVGDYTFDPADLSILYLTLARKGEAYIYLVKSTGYAVALSNIESNLKKMKLEIED